MAKSGLRLRAATGVRPWKSRTKAAFSCRVFWIANQTARRALVEANAKVMKAFGMQRGVSHTEFIGAAEDGKIYFLETSARVGGAHVSDLIEAATGLNMWEEWAKVETADDDYPTPVDRGEYAGLLVTLARQEHPDTSIFNDPEVVWRMAKEIITPA